MTKTAAPDLSRITVIPGQRSGQPCIRGLRVTVWDVLDMLASGMTEEEILEDFPYLERADFPAVLCLCVAIWTGTSTALKLLFDANLSPKLVARLSQLFPESKHVFDTGLERFTRDEEI